MKGDSRGVQVAAGPVAADEEYFEISKHYQIRDKLGEGTYGVVYRATCLQTNAKVAIKKVKIVYQDEGVPTTALREIGLLKECNHQNVVHLIDVHSTQRSLFLIFECLDMDLRVYLRRHGALRDAQLRHAAHQCFSGVEYCHGKRVLHRDLKPQNVLVDEKTMRFVLADFGLARFFSAPLKVYTHEVVTLWYRAPEVLLGQHKYGPPLDIWSLGCIFGEMLMGQALFQGDSEIGTLFKIFKMLGTPTEEVWPGVTTLIDYKPCFPKWQDSGFADIRRHENGSLGEHGIDLISSCLKYNALDRPSAKRALQHVFFAADDVSVDIAISVDTANVCRCGYDIEACGACGMGNAQRSQATGSAARPSSSSDGPVVISDDVIATGIATLNTDRASERRPPAVLPPPNPSQVLPPAQMAGYPGAVGPPPLAMCDEAIWQAFAHREPHVYEAMSTSDVAMCTAFYTSAMK